MIIYSNNFIRFFVQHILGLLLIVSAFEYWILIFLGAFVIMTSFFSFNIKRETIVE